jgi:hypothetical protein
MRRNRSAATSAIGFVGFGGLSTGSGNDGNHGQSIPLKNTANFSYSVDQVQVLLDFFEHLLHRRFRQL